MAQDARKLPPRSAAFPSSAVMLTGRARDFKRSLPIRTTAIKTLYASMPLARFLLDGKCADDRMGKR